MFKKLNVSNSGNFDKPNLKFLKFITIFLAILILICVVLLVFGFFKSYNKLSSKKEISNEKKEITSSIQIIDEIEIFQPKNSQLISSSLGGGNKLLLRYQSEGNNVIIIIDIDRKVILKKIFLKNGKEWKIN